MDAELDIYWHFYWQSALFFVTRCSLPTDLEERRGTESAVAHLALRLDFGEFQSEINSNAKRLIIRKLLLSGVHFGVRTSRDDFHHAKGHRSSENYASPIRPDVRRVSYD